MSENLESKDSDIKVDAIEEGVITMKQLVRSWSSFWTSIKPMEPCNEGIYLWF